MAAFSGERPVMVMPLNSANSVDKLAKDILANAPPAFALAGLSMGGIVAMEVIRQTPERVTKLALLDTNPRAELPGVKARRVPQIDAVRSGRLRDVMRDEMKPKYLADGPDKSRILKLCMDMANTLGADAFVSQSQALADRPDQCETLKTVRVPTLILCGREDILCPVDYHELMHVLVPGSTLTIIEKAGHLSVLEQPGPTNEALRKWLN